MLEAPLTSAPTKDQRISGGPLLAIDGDSFVHRAFHGVPKTIRRGDNRPGNAIVGFGNYLVRLYAAERPRAIIVCWDTLEVPTYRHQALAAYQSGREFAEELLEQLAALPALVTACGFANAKAPGFEADDFLAAAVAYEEKRGGSVIVASGDRDTFQLASEQTIILHPVRAGEMARIGPAEVRERYGVEPKQVPDFIALRGDPSDKIPGARGVGAKGAADLLRNYGTLEEALTAGRFPTQAAELRLYRRIATMDKSAPLPDLRNQKPSWGEGAGVAREWGLDQLANRFAELGK
jgi:DNA polymerase I